MQKQADRLYPLRWARQKKLTRHIQDSNDQVIKGISASYTT